MSLIFLCLFRVLLDPLRALRERLSAYRENVPIAWDLLGSEWRDHPPTPGEIRAHAQNHPMWGPSALWVYVLPTDQTVMLAYVYLGHPDPAVDAGRIAEALHQGAVMWRPCRLFGEPCRWPKVARRS